MELSVTTSGEKILLADVASGETVVLPFILDAAQNCSHLPLCESNAPGQTPLLNGFQAALNAIFSAPEPDGLPWGRAEQVLMLSFLYRECIRRNQPLRWLFAAPGVWRTTGWAQGTLRLFAPENMAFLVDDSDAPVPEGGFRGPVEQLLNAFGDSTLGGAVLEGGAAVQNPALCGMLLRKLRTGGLLVMRFSRDETPPQALAACTGGAERIVFSGSAFYALRVTAALQNEALAGCADAQTAGLAQELIDLWGQTLALLNDVLSVEAPGPEEIQKGRDAVVRLHTMEDILIRLHPYLDNLDLKYLCNRAKTAAMDYYLEIEMARPYVKTLREGLERAGQTLADALQTEFPVFFS